MSNKTMTYGLECYVHIRGNQQYFKLPKIEIVVILTINDQNFIGRKQDSSF